MMSSAIPQLQKRKPDAHKGDFGRALIVGGSRGLTGAVSLAGMSALRSGAGLATIAVPDACLETVAAHEPSYMTLPLPADELARLTVAATAPIQAAATNCTAATFGPGLGQSDDLTELTTTIYATVAQPMVFDADGLNALARRKSAIESPGGPRILTPHPGELARLTNVDADDRERQIEAATQLARECGVVVLKGHRTVITDGQTQFVNETGNPGMATGGSGDVLSGVITALLCQRLKPLDAARLGVHVHGRAGDLAADALGEVSLTARDLIDFLPIALREVCAE